MKMQHIFIVTEKKIKKAKWKKKTSYKTDGEARLDIIGLFDIQRDHILQNLSVE